MLKTHRGNRKSKGAARVGICIPQLGDFETSVDGDEVCSKCMHNEWTSKQTLAVLK